MSRLFYSQTSMSLQESILLGSFMAILISILWKWNKVLLFLVNLELVSIFVFTALVMAGMTQILLLLMVFFVSEALILLSSFFSSMRVMGASHSSIMLW